MEFDVANSFLVLHVPLIDPLVIGETPCISVRISFMLIST